MIRVHTEVFTAMGRFRGYCTEALNTIEEAASRRDAIQNILKNCDMFTIFSDEVEGQEITLNEGAIKNSVFKFTLIEVN